MSVLKSHPSLIFYLNGMAIDFFNVWFVTVWDATIQRSLEWLLSWEPKRHLSILIHLAQVPLRCLSFSSLRSSCKIAILGLFDIWLFKLRRLIFQSRIISGRRDESQLGLAFLSVDWLTSWLERKWIFIEFVALVTWRGLRLDDICAT